MKATAFPWLIPVAGLIAGVLILFDSGNVVPKLIRFLPSRDEHSVAYNEDLVRLAATELIWISLALAVFLALWQSTLFPPFLERLNKTLVRRSRTIIAAVLLFYLAVSIITAAVTLRAFPNSADEYAYLFQAADLNKGRLWSNVHGNREFFEFDHIAQKDGKWIGRFPPGWPLVLSLAFLISVPAYTINVLAGLLSLYFFYRLMQRFYNELVALWSVIGVAVTSFFLFNAASYFSHTISLLEIVLAMYLTVLCFQTGRKIWAIPAGFCVGMLAITRPYTAVLLFGVFYFWIMVQHKRRAVIPLLLSAIGALPCIGFLLWYNGITTGNALLPVTMWAYPEEGLGFSGEHSPAAGIKHIVKRLLMLIYWVSPHFLVLYGVLLIAVMRKPGWFRREPGYLFFPVLLAGYILYYSYGGNQYGPRFYFEGFPFLVGFLAAGVLYHHGGWGKVLFVTGIAYGLVRIPFISARENRIVNERMDLYDQVAAARLQNAVVLIGAPTGVIRPMDQENLTRNDRQYANPVLYALDLGERNAALMRRYPERKFFRYDRNPEEPRGRLTEISHGSPIVTGAAAEEQHPEIQSLPTIE